MVCAACGYPNPPSWGSSVAHQGPPGTFAPRQSDDNVMAMLVHLLGLLTGFVGPLVLWLVKRRESPFIDRHGRTALNWQFTILAVVLGALIATVALMLVLIGFLLFPFAILLALAASVANIVFPIIAAVRAHEGKEYRYPMCIPFLKLPA